MELINETEDEPIYEAENGDSGGGPFPKKCRKGTLGHPSPCMDGGKALGYVGQFKAKGEAHQIPVAKKEGVIMRFYEEGKTGNDWCDRFVVDGRKNYVLAGETCGAYTLNIA